MIYKATASEEALRHADSSSPPSGAQSALRAGETKDFTGCYGRLFTGEVWIVTTTKPLLLIYHNLPVPWVSAAGGRGKRATEF